MRYSKLRITGNADAGPLFLKKIVITKVGQNAVCYPNYITIDEQGTHFFNCLTCGWAELSMNELAHKYFLPFTGPLYAGHTILGVVF